MRIILLLTFLCLQPLQARMYLEFHIKNAKELQQLDEALRLGQKLRTSLKSLLKHSPEDGNIQKIRSQIEKFEEQMFKSYGMIPGLTYLTVPTSGVIHILVPENKVAEYIKEGVSVKAGTPMIVVKDSQGNNVKCFKVTLRELKTRDSVQTFNQALQSAESIRARIKSLETQLEKKPELKKDPKLQEGMKQLKDTLSLLDKELLVRYNVKPRFKYIFEPLTGAVYLNISESDLKKLGEMKKNEK